MKTWLVVTYADWNEETHSSAKVTADSIRIHENGFGFYIAKEAKNPDTDDFWEDDTLVLFVPKSRIYSISLDGYEGIKSE